MLTVPGELYPELWLEQKKWNQPCRRPEGGDFLMHLLKYP